MNGSGIFFVKNIYHFSMYEIVYDKTYEEESFF